MLIIKNASGGGSNIINSGKPSGDIDIDLKQFLDNDSYPIGSILLYGLTPGELKTNDPKGKWAICNGAHGTPDLRNKFIMGAASPTEANQHKTGGSADISYPEHSHSISMSEHAGHPHPYNPPKTNSTVAGKHRHVQRMSPRHGAQGIIPKAYPPGKPRKAMNRGVYRTDKGDSTARVNEPCSLAGKHRHSVNVAGVYSSNAGNHSHSTITIHDDGGSSKSGKGKNLPRNIKAIYIMKIK